MAGSVYPGNQEDFLFSRQMSPGLTRVSLRVQCLWLLGWRLRSERNTRYLYIGLSKRIVDPLVFRSIGRGLRVFVVLLLIL